MRKARQADSSASSDLRDYLKSKKTKGEDQNKQATPASSAVAVDTPIVISDSPPPPPTLPLASLVSHSVQQQRIQQLHKTQAELIQKLLQSARK